PDEAALIPSPLRDIILKAMQPEPAGRFQSVAELKEALQKYQSHAESLNLQSSARKTLQEAEQARDYALFTRATVTFEQAISLWADSPDARSGLADARRAHAECALSKGDLELAISLVD